MTEFGELKGSVISAIDVSDDGDGDDHVDFTLVDGRRFRMYHREDCCESVDIESIDGDVTDLIGHPLTLAEEITHGDCDSGDPPHPDMVRPGEYADGWLWTFYKLATVKGYVTIRWVGTSNGYYSESVDFVEVDQNGMVKR